MLLVLTWWRNMKMWWLRWWLHRWRGQTLLAAVTLTVWWRTSLQSQLYIFHQICSWDIEALQKNKNNLIVFSLSIKFVGWSRIYLVVGGWEGRRKSSHGENHIFLQHKIPQRLSRAKEASLRNVFIVKLPGSSSEQKKFPIHTPNHVNGLLLRQRIYIYIDGCKCQVEKRVM